MPWYSMYPGVRGFPTVLMSVYVERRFGCFRFAIAETSCSGRSVSAMEKARKHDKTLLKHAKTR